MTARAHMRASETSGATDVCFMTAGELAACIRRRAVSPVEVVDAFLERIERRNERLNAYVTVLADRAREQARRAERVLVSGADVGILHGVPIAVKDLFDSLAGVRNTLGSKVFAEYVPDVSATYFQRLESAGAIILGKTNTAELGHKGITDNLLFGPTSTPFAIGKNAGGSSGGSAAAVADHLATVAQGSDGGGSIRIPAAFCGVYGFKASFGRVASAYRPDAFLAQTPFIVNGPITRTVEDAALILGVICGPDPRDPTSLPNDGIDFFGATRRSIRGLKIGYCPDLDSYPLSPAVRRVVDAAVHTFDEMGAIVEPVRLGLPHRHEVITETWLGQAGGLYASAALTFKGLGIDLLREHRDEIAPELAALIERGLAMNAAEFRQLDRIRTGLFDAVQDAFERHDVLIAATTCVPPFDNAPDRRTLGPSEIEGESVERTIGFALTPLFNFTGHPVASVPAGLTDDGLPVGMQVVGRRFADDSVLTVSAAFERARPWQHVYPT